MSRLATALVVAGLALMMVPRVLPHPVPGAEVHQVSTPAPGEPSVVAEPQTTEPAVTPSTTSVTRSFPSVTRSFPSSSTTSSTLAATAATRVPADRHEIDYPITQALPYETAHFSIDYRLDAPNRLSLIVTVLVVTNGASDLAGRRATLAAYKAEALAWLASKGVSPTLYPVTWRPADA